MLSLKSVKEVEGPLKSYQDYRMFPCRRYDAPVARSAGVRNDEKLARPAQNPFRVSVCAARALNNNTGPSRVTLSLQ